MLVAPPCSNEESRLAALLRYKVLDTEAEGPYDDIVSLASTICRKPISLVSLVDEDRQWFKARVGLDAEQTPRDVAFCSHAILQDDVFVVENALEDMRFSDNPLVTDGPKIRFYAGAPLVTHDGHPLGTLCVIDRAPGEINEEQKNALKILARQVISQLELRLSNSQLSILNREKDNFIRLLSHDLRSAFGATMGFAQMLHRRVSVLSPTQAENVAHKIYKSADQGLKLLESTLSWARLQNDGPKIRKDSFSLSALCTEVTEYLSELAHEKDITLNVSCDEALTIESDHALLRSVLQNLVHNAIKFSNESSAIDISFSDQQDSILLTVQDYGVGIPESKACRLFSQYNETTKGTNGEIGMGIGTQLIQEFTHHYNGTTSIESSVGNGTKISIELPK